MIPILESASLKDVRDEVHRVTPLMPIWKPTDFLDFQPPQDFLLMGDCHLTRGGLTVLGGWPGVGKSRAAMALAIAGATGGSWFGHPLHARFRSLVVQCENGPYRLKSELEPLARMASREVLDEWVRITPPPPYGLAFQELEFRALLRERIAELRPGLVIIDPWNRAADGDKQADYRGALDAIFSCLPEDMAERPALLILHHMRKKSSEGTRKSGRDLLHELAGSYQIGSAARCVFALEPASNRTEDDTVVLTCCKNNDGKEGPPSAWHRRDGFFTAYPEFDMEGFLSGEEVKKERGVPFKAIETALCGMRGETRTQAANRLVSAELCARARAFVILNEHPNHIVEDENGRLWWQP
ncbi:AAA family ATPase [Luteolibacter sp. LG18]|uniref:AAA family ATPase n=1 Tax=Luteolibacter sp. LG18 TaxID=2819286 RepID=UPI002B300246|nr:hypothetical protein llg_38020 [Luteolibacter sp. LG18]